MEETRRLLETLGTILTAGFPILQTRADEVERSVLV
jgi:hypothetical protein